MARLKLFSPTFKLKKYLNVGEKSFRRAINFVLLFMAQIWWRSRAAPALFHEGQPYKTNLCSLQLLRFFKNLKEILSTAGAFCFFQMFNTVLVLAYPRWRRCTVNSTHRPSCRSPKQCKFLFISKHNNIDILYLWGSFLSLILTRIKTMAHSKYMTGWKNNNCVLYFGVKSLAVQIFHHRTQHPVPTSNINV